MHVNYIESADQVICRAHSDPTGILEGSIVMKTGAVDALTGVPLVVAASSITLTVGMEVFAIAYPADAVNGPTSPNELLRLGGVTVLQPYGGSASYVEDNRVNPEDANWIKYSPALMKNPKIPLGKPAIGYKGGVMKFWIDGTAGFSVNSKVSVDTAGQLVVVSSGPHIGIVMERRAGEATIRLYNTVQPYENR